MTTEKDILDWLWDNPGKSWDDIFKAFDITDRLVRLKWTHENADDMLKSGRLSCIRFTSYAPFLRTTFMLFATEHGRIEIINNQPLDFAGFQIGHIHDPYGKWDEKMEEALRD